MKKKLVIITILNVCMLFSCKNNVKEPTSGNYIVDYNNSKPMMPDEIRYKLEYILLSTEQEESLFSLGNKFSLINNKIYVLDEIKAKNVLVFKDNGEFERQVGARGQGPGEYIQANDFSIDSQGNVYVYDGPKKQLLLYNTENICIKSLQLPFDIHNFTVLPNGKFLFWLAQYNKGKSKGYQVALTDSLLNVEKEYIPYTQYFDANMVMGSYFQQTDNKFIYYHGISDSAYIFTQDGDLEGNIYIDFGDNKAPEKFRDNLMEIIKNQEYQYLSYSPFIIKNYIMGCIIDKKDVISFVYDTKNKTMYKNSEFKFGEINSPKSYVNDSTFISVFNEAYLPPDFMSDSILTDEQKKHIYEDGGTIICKYTLLQ